MNSCKQKGGGAYSTWDSEEERQRLEEWERYEKEQEKERIRKIKNNLKNNPEEFKAAMNQLYKIPEAERFSGMKKKKHKKKKSSIKKPKKKKATNHSKKSKQGGGKSRKPKKAKQTRKRPKRSRLSRRSKLAGYNPYPIGTIGGSYK